MTFKLLCEVVEDIQVITEAATDGKKSYFIEGTFLQSNTKNRNGRIYPRDILSNQIKTYNENFVLKQRAFGELGHPDNPTINLDRVSHKITKISEDGDNFVGRAKIMNTPNGKIVQALMDEECKLGVSSRGLGSLTERNGAKYVSDDFFLTTAGDIVADPSAPLALVDNIMESMNWIQQGNAWVPIMPQGSSENNMSNESLIERIKEFEEKLERIDEARNNIRKTVRKTYQRRMTAEEKEQLFYGLFEDYISTLTDSIDQ